MFTGIVQGVGKISAVIEKPGMRTLSVELPPQLSHNLAVGASIAVDGVCLTVTSIDHSLVNFDIIQETLDKTTLKDVKEGSLVNIERAAKFGDEIGGHLLSGHVFGTGTVANIQISPNNHVLTISLPAAIMKYFFQKGYIALDGISLTVVNTSANNTLTVHIIPETLKVTTLGRKKIGDSINIEIDSQTQVIVDTVEKYTQTHLKK